jgi:hypothetical protein
LLEVPPDLLDEVEVTEDPTVTAKVLEQGATALLAALDALGS